MKTRFIILSLLSSISAYAVVSLNSSESALDIIKFTQAATINNHPICESASKANAALAKPKQHPRRHIRHYHHQVMITDSRANLQKLFFDFTYSGDVLAIPDELRQYDPQLKVLSPLGKMQHILVNIDLQNASFEDINDALSNQTSNRVRLIYDEANDTIRLSFTTLADVGRDAVDESLKWQHGILPRPVLKADGVVRFPYGEYQPIVICQPLNLCDIELQAGEVVQGIVIGDSMRWNEGDKGVPVVYSGTGDNLTPHLVLKPDQAGLDTSLMVTTSRRTYMFKLKSASDGYVARVGFYYPDELITRFENNKQQLRDASESIIKSNNPDVQMPLINLANVQYRYTIEGKDYSWKPTQVFDDGISVYIQLPDMVSSSNLPGLCVTVVGEDSKDQCEMVNFRYNDHFYIVDELFTEAKLVNGFGDNMQVITIKRKEERSSFWSKMF